MNFSSVLNYLFFTSDAKIYTKEADHERCLIIMDYVAFIIFAIFLSQCISKLLKSSIFSNIPAHSRRFSEVVMLMPDYSQTAAPHVFCHFFIFQAELSFSQVYNLLEVVYQTNKARVVLS